MASQPLIPDDLLRRSERAFLACVAGAIRPDPTLTVSEWADQYRMLDPATSAEHGNWHTDRTPYLREIMDSISATDPCEQVTFMKAAQIGGSEVINNAIGYCCDHNPSPIMLVQPRIDDAKNYVKRRLVPMFLATPKLYAIGLSSAKTRDSDNTILNRSFPGGFLVATGANSGVGLRSNPVRRVFFDEVDGYPIDVNEEGDPVDLGIQRTATFPNRKIVLVSTPTLRGHSRIEAAFEAGDKRRYHVPCPKCGTFQTLAWRNVIWPSGQPELARYRCAHCQDDANDRHLDELIQNHEKTHMLAAGYWEAENPAMSRIHKSYHINALYAPDGWFSFGDLARQFVIAKKDPVKLKVFVNTKLAETWDSSEAAPVKPDGLCDRREDWGKQLPSKVALVTAGVDVQIDRLEIGVWGWSADAESWSLDYRQLWGDPTAKKVWQDLDKLLDRRYTLIDGTELVISAACVDTGGSATQHVYDYISTRQRQRKWAVKGKAGQIPIWPKRPSKAYKGKVQLFSIGVDVAKEDIYNRLRREEPGAGYCHFGMDWDTERFEQLTAETQGVKYHKGFKKFFWHKPDGRPNEALDCFVYAYAALHGLASMGLTAQVELDSRQGTVKTAKQQPPRAVSPAQGSAPSRRAGWLQRGSGKRSWL